jgi:glycosyltransferase involved in cell wall biosynthesis
MLKQRSGKSNLPMLLLAGNYEKDDQFPKIRSKIAELGISSDTKLLGFVPDEELASLYQSADLFVFPSLYEGFGFPVLEAMACGTPVVAGSNSSLPEVAGTSSVLLPDMNTGVWVQAIDGLLESESALDELSVSGISRAQKFSWERTARETLNAYRHFSGMPETASEAARPIQATLGR